MNTIVAKTFDEVCQCLPLLNPLVSLHDPNFCFYNFRIQTQGQTKEKMFLIDGNHQLRHKRYVNLSAVSGGSGQLTPRKEHLEI